MNKDFWLNRNVLVTGGAGFLGNHLVGELVKLGAVVTVIARDDVRLGLGWAINRVAHGDVTDRIFVERVLEENEIDTVFHLAAQVIVPIANYYPYSTFESNVHGTYSVLEACRSGRHANRIIVASTDKVYGEMKDRPYLETDRLDAVQPYDVSKVCTDVIAQSYYRHFGLNVGITRAGNYYGPGDHNWSRIIPGTIRDIMRGKRPTIRSSGRAIREYFYVKDAVEANIMLAERVDEYPGEAFNFSSGISCSTIDLVNKILDMMGSKLEPIVLFGAEGEINAQMLDCRKARDLLGWVPKTSLDDGLIETIRYYKEELKVESAAYN